MQKTELKRTSASLLASAVLAVSSVAFASSALAATETGNTSAQASAAADARPGAKSKGEHRKGAHHRGHKRHQHRMEEAAMLVPGYGPVSKDVVESLSLTDKQQALVADAKSFMKDQHEAQQDRFKSVKADRSAPATPTTLDPHARVKKQDEFADAMREVRAEATRKWLAVWDSLEPKQQQTLAEHVADRHEKRAQRRTDHQEKRAAKKAGKS